MAAQLPEEFWPVYGTHPVVDRMVRAHHFRTDQLTRTPTA